MLLLALGIVLDLVLQLDRVEADNLPRVEGIISGPVDFEFHAFRPRTLRGNLRTLVPEVQLLFHLHFQTPVRAALTRHRAGGALSAVFEGGHRVGLVSRLVHCDLERVAFPRIVHLNLETLRSCPATASLDHDLHTARFLLGTLPLGLLTLLLVVHGHRLRVRVAWVHLLELGDERLAQGSRILPEFAVLFVVHLRVAQHEFAREEELPHRLVTALLVEALADGIKVDGMSDLLVVVWELLPCGQEDEQLRHLATVAILQLLDLLEDVFARLSLLRRQSIVVGLLALTFAAVVIGGCGVVVVKVVLIRFGVGFLGLGPGARLACRTRGLIVVRVFNETLVDAKHGAISGKRLDEDVRVLSEDGKHGRSRPARASQLGGLCRLRCLHELVKGERLGSLIECILGGGRGGSKVEVRLFALVTTRGGADTVSALGIVVGIVSRIRSGILLPRATWGPALGFGDDHRRTSVHGGARLHGTSQRTLLVLVLHLLLPSERSKRISFVHDILGLRRRPAPRPHPHRLIDRLIDLERPRQRLVGEPLLHGLDKSPADDASFLVNLRVLVVVNLRIGQHQLNRDCEHPRGGERAFGGPPQDTFDTAAVHRAPDDLVVVRQFARGWKRVEGFDEEPRGLILVVRVVIWVWD
mmetsp:Transcript_2549/g.9561  ORF Transcript_2549/g.9561 Transcript_2549/m.9561 type:complete len:641 (+) Transcript_2549:76-1998(+)